MKPFNLEAAQAGAPIMTRDGRKAKFIAYVPELRPSRQVVILVAGLEALEAYYPDGSYLSGNTTHAIDLSMAPVKKTVWVNFHRGGVAYYFENKDDAMKDAEISVGCVTNTAPVEIEE